MLYTKEQFLDAVTNEFRIYKHLAEKIPAGTDGYKPTEGQRSTLELLQYVAVVFAATAEVILKNDMSLYSTLMPSSAEVSVANFADMMDRQEAKFKEILAQYTDEDFATVINMYGMGDKPKAVYLVESILKWLAAYKMQLFLYIKASGNTSLGTSNLWGGVDMPMNQ